MAGAIDARSGAIQVLQNTAPLHQARLFALMTQPHQLLLQALELLHLHPNELDVMRWIPDGSSALQQQ